MASQSKWYVKRATRRNTTVVGGQVLAVSEEGLLTPVDGSDYTDDCVAQMRRIPQLFREKRVAVPSPKKEVAPDSPIIELVVVESEADIPVEQKAPAKKSPAKKKAATKKAPAKKASKKKPAAKKKSAAKKSE